MHFKAKGNTTATLKQKWFERIAQCHQATTDHAGLACATRCTGRCCPHAAMATRPPNYTVSHVAIMLPFEMEYILSKIDVNPDCFQRAPIDIAPNITLEIGFFNVEKPCPFLTEQYWCRAYNARPLDCRSFPLVPVFGADGTMHFRVDTHCPSVDTFSLTYQAQLKQVWEELLPDLPTQYRILYNQL